MVVVKADIAKWTEIIPDHNTSNLTINDINVREKKNCEIIICMCNTAAIIII